MGYDIHITRAPHWTESHSVAITLDEWKAFVADDPDMRMANFAEATSPAGETIRYENEGLAAWIPGACENPAGWFDYRNGRIVVKNPDEAMLAKIKRVAELLGARVMGDEGELY